MKKVVTINLGGNAYQLEEDGFAVLGDYLETARMRLQGNPDIEEVIMDLELAVADKMHRFLSANKTVVTTGEIEEIVDEMGPVENGLAHETESAAATDSRRAENEPPTQRKLYKLTHEDEKMLAGVCAGLAAYSGLDVSIVRIAFVALVLATSGLALIAYLALALIMPEARTPQQQAAAYGVPFDARGVIDQAKSKLGVGDGRPLRAQSRYRSRHARRAGAGGTGALLGLGILLLGLLVGLILFSSIVRVSGIGANPMFHSAPPAWLGLLVLIAGVYLLAGIAGGGRRESGSAAGSLLATAMKAFLLLVLFWLAYRTMPFVRELVDTLLRMLSRIFWW